jgi:transcriptional regulator with XRE-family HTH domain
MLKVENMAAAITKPLEQVLSTLGIQLKALRIRQGWTLEQLSSRSTLSEPYLSRLESGTRQPSLAALLTLARVYNTPLAELLGDSEPQSARCTIVRAGAILPRVGNGLKYRPVSGGAELADLQAFEVTLPPSRDLKKFNHHEGEEWLYILEGRLGLLFAHEEHWLESGDSVHFDSSIDHRLVTDKTSGAKLLLVASAAAHPNPPRLLI